MARQLEATRFKWTKTTRSTQSNKVQVAIFIVALVYFLTPWIAAAMYGFSRPGEPFTMAPLVDALQQNSERFIEAILNTIFLAVMSTLLMLAILVPTNIFLNMKSQSLAKMAEVISVLPMVVPAVALVSGVSQFYRAVAPAFLTSIWSLVPLYVILAMPLCYRAIDAGVKALDLRTLFAASASLGASTWSTLRDIVLPNLRTAMLSASLLCITLCLGEFAMAQLLLHYTFPVFLTQIASSQPKGIAALSFITTIITWLLLVAISSMSGSRSRKR